MLFLIVILSVAILSYMPDLSCDTANTIFVTKSGNNLLLDKKIEDSDAIPVIVSHKITSIKSLQLKTPIKVDYVKI